MSLRGSGHKKLVNCIHTNFERERLNVVSYLSPEVGPQNVAYIDKELSGKKVLLFSIVTSSAANARNTSRYVLRLAHGPVP